MLGKSEEVRLQRRLVGIDLGIASAHTVRVLDEAGREVCRRRCEPTVDSLTAIEQTALAETATGTRLEVVVEPTGPAWLPIAVFFTARGHLVFRVSSAKAADLRRFLSRHAKSNGIDADTLARLPLIAPDGLHPLQLPGAEAAALDRRVRACDRLTMAASEHKVRIKDLVRQVMPCTPLTGDLGKADLAVLERYGDPRVLLKAGRARLTAVIADPARFASAAHFKSYLGLAPRASETGNTDRKGQPMSKAGSRLARATLIRAADHARKQDPQLARVYHQQMVERGAEHLKANCVVAARLAERLWTVMRRRMPYVIRDVDGAPVTPQQAKQIIAEQWTVTDEVRRRRRSNNSGAGKAPHQVRTGHDQDARSVTRRPSPRRSSAKPPQTVKPTNHLTLDPR